MVGVIKMFLPVERSASTVSPEKARTGRRLGTDRYLADAKLNTIVLKYLETHHGLRPEVAQ